MAKVGDTVRFLNSVGGGRIVRIDGKMAFVDEDGFETPVLLRDCVVVATGDTFYAAEHRKKQPETEKRPEPEPAVQPAPLPPAEETPEGEKLNLTLAFEPADIKQLSRTTFDAFFVNDSNYAMYVTIGTRPADDDRWTLRYAGLIEPSIQEFVFELTTDDLPELGRIAVQAIPFKSGNTYAHKPAVDFEQRIDATKFAKLHCFVKNPYFDNSQVLAIDIVKDDAVQAVMNISQESLQKALTEKSRADKANGGARQRVSKPAQRPTAPLEVDLHAGVLLDTLSGLSKSDILNYQIDTFRKVMDENLRHPGRKIIFIHGKGDGVLRAALMKELNHRYKGHDVADASFREYGFGATQVTIRKIR